MLFVLNWRIQRTWRHGVIQIGNYRSGDSKRVTRVTNRLRRYLDLGQCVDGNLKSGLNVLFFPPNNAE